MPSRNDRQKQKEVTTTPFTISIAVAFFICILVFIQESYFWASEYYASGPPYFAIVVISGLLTLLVFVLLKRAEPERKDSHTYALLLGIGFALVVYALVPRINIWTDDEGLANHSYVLNPDYIWESVNYGPPKLDLYMKSSDWWQQYEPGDEYTFQMRRGGLGIWQVNMTQIYDDQQKFYDCEGSIECMFE